MPIDNTYYVIVNSSPASGATIGGGTIAGASPQYAYVSEGTSITLIAAATLGGRAFVGWRQDSGTLVSTSRNITQTIIADTTYTAVYAPTGGEFTMALSVYSIDWYGFYLLSEFKSGSTGNVTYTVQNGTLNPPTGIGQLGRPDYLKPEQLYTIHAVDSIAKVSNTSFYLPRHCFPSAKIIYTPSTCTALAQGDMVLPADAPLNVIPLAGGVDPSAITVHFNGLTTVPGASIPLSNALYRGYGQYTGTGDLMYTAYGYDTYEFVADATLATDPVFSNWTLPSRVTWDSVNRCLDVVAGATQRIAIPFDGNENEDRMYAGGFWMNLSAVPAGNGITGYYAGNVIINTTGGAGSGSTAVAFVPLTNIIYNGNDSYFELELDTDVQGKLYGFTLNEYTIYSDYDVVNLNPVTSSFVSSTDATCPGLANGTATIHIANGTAPYVFYVDGVATRFTSLGGGNYQVGNLSAGVYSLTVGDQGPCGQTTPISVTIEEPPLLFTVINSITNITCHGLSNGAINVVGSGGTGPYTYSINNGSFSSTHIFTSLAAGTYSIRTKDANGCLAPTITITITQPTAITYTSTQGNISTPGGNDGFITLTVSGGTFPITITWDDGAVYTLASAGTIIHNNLTVGDYVALIQDAHGCTVTFDTQLTEPSVTVPPDVENPDQDIIDYTPIANCCLGDEIYNVFKFLSNGKTDIDCIAIPAMLLAQKVRLLDSYYTAGQTIGGAKGYFALHITSPTGFTNATISYSFDGISVTYIGDAGLTYDENADALATAIVDAGGDAEYEIDSGIIWVYSGMNSVYNGQIPILTSHSTLTPFGPLSIVIYTSNGFMGACTPCITDNLLICITEEQKNNIIEQIRAQCKTCVCGEPTSNS